MSTAADACGWGISLRGSHRINGVSALHTELMRQTVSVSSTSFMQTASSTRRTHHFSPLAHAGQSRFDRALARGLRAAVLDDQTTIVRLADHADDASLQERFGAVKRANKVALGVSYERMGLRVDQMRCSTCRSSASMNTNANCSTFWKRSRSMRRCART